MGMACSQRSSISNLTAITPIKVSGGPIDKKEKDKDNQTPAMLFPRSPLLFGMAWRIGLVSLVGQGFISK